MPRDDPNMLRPQPSREGQPDAWMTPPDLVMALIRHVLPELPRATVWDPAMGDGVMLRAINQAGYKTFGTDAFAVADPVDFLTHIPTSKPVLVTNPPFNALDEWIGHAVGLLHAGHLKGVALLLRGDHLGAARRAWHLNRASKLYVCAWRPRWIKGTTTSPRFWFTWVVWGPTQEVLPEIVWLTPEDIT